MEWPWLIVCLGVLLIGVTKSGFGAGVGLFNIPLIVLAMGHTERGSQAALGLMLPLLILGDFIAIWQYRKLFKPGAFLRATPDVDDKLATVSAPQSEIEPSSPPAPVVLDYAHIDSASRTGPQLIKALLPGTIIGVILGGMLLWWFHQYQALVNTFIRLEIGFECVVLVGLHWWRQYKGVQTHLMPEPWRSWITGCFAAVSSTLAHAAGPIIAMYLLPLRLDRQLFVGTCALYFFLLNTAKLPAYYASGMFAQAELGFTIKFAPLVIVGAALGYWVLRKLSDKIFAVIIYSITFLMGWYLLGDGVYRLIQAL